MIRKICMAVLCLVATTDFAMAQNPAIGTVEGQTITLDTIQDGQLFKLRQQMYFVFRERMQGFALTELAKRHPEYALQPVAVTDTDLEQYYKSSGASAYGTPEQLKVRLTTWISARKAHDQLETLWAKALAEGLVTETLASPSPFNPKIAVRPESVEGNPKASVLLIEYADFQCPYCRQVRSTVESVLAEYDGRAAFLHLNFPLDIHPGSFESAVASECARDQGQFHAYAVELYGLDAAKQRSKVFVELAAKHRLDTSRFAKCLDDPKSKERVNSDVEATRFIGITATPSFVIGTWDHRTNTVTGEQITGAVDAGTLKAALDKVLAR